MVADPGPPLGSFTVVGRMVADRTIYNFLKCSIKFINNPYSSVNAFNMAIATMPASFSSA